ncbi:D-alanine--D-alanine ligase [Auraticoccus sp. F435]|uniref:D-alanine--D-alanine ligase n=1 Tax=Auraticoccus cholistanensis TaxID=2656650 RepID=A0A6A9UWQ4_9ACTN|nr:D-alanine--D-alanine ligase family protein [Auraticoccus cholistanensis]MVA75647.1 D-alanine--D-alanine ligase [Auraticoccus cholistanensis]
MTDTRRPSVAVVFGGASSEHGVSCLTAASVVRALDRSRYDVVGIGITPDGRWLRVEADDVVALATVDGQLPSVPEGHPTAVLLHGTGAVQLASRDLDTLLDPVPVDVAFALLHGPFGEDGTIQGMFEMLGLRYVGSGVAASAVSMDKQLMKQVLAASGLPVGPYTAFTAAEWRDDPSARLDAVLSLGLPVFVKPARGGSSIGISRVDDPDHLAAAVETALRHDARCVVEKGLVDVRELECGVLEGPDGLEVTAAAEIRTRTASGFYDFQAKYLPEAEQVELLVPAEVDPVLAERLRDTAVRTFRAVGAEGLARVDTFVTADGQVVVNEINTMPGFTEHSMFPMVWAASGVAYPELVGRLLEHALQRPLGLR